MKRELRDEATKLLVADLVAIRDDMTAATSAGVELDRAKLWTIADQIAAAAQYAARIVSDEEVSSSVLTMIGESHASIRREES